MRVKERNNGFTDKSLNLFFVYTQFVNDLNFERARKDNKNIQSLYKFGIALSSKEKFPVFGLFNLRGGGLDVTEAHKAIATGQVMDCHGRLPGSPESRW